MTPAARTAEDKDPLNNAAPFQERRSSHRSSELQLRRRYGDLRIPHTRPAAVLVPDAIAERRRNNSSGFDVAKTLELNLKNFPTKAGMQTLLHSWLYAAERNGLVESRPDYVAGLMQAIATLRSAAEPAE